MAMTGQACLDLQAMQCVHTICITSMQKCGKEMLADKHAMPALRPGLQPAQVCMQLEGAIAGAINEAAAADPT